MAIDFFSSIDLNKNEIQNAVVQNSGSDPGSPIAGQIYYNSGDNTLRFHNGSSFQTLSTTTGDITGVTAGTGLTGGGSSGDVTLNVIGGDGITANANDVAITAAQTTITSVLNASLVVGRDSDNQIKFSTDDQIIFRVGGGDGVTFKASGEIEATSLDISGDADIDGTLEADAITVGGTALNTVIAGVTVANATLAATVTVADSTANTAFPVVLHDESNALLDDTGAFTYNPSSGLLTVPNLTVSGTTTTVNTTNLTVEDNNIVLSSGNSTSAVINGAGLTLEGGSGDDATFTYSTSGPKFELKLGSSYEDLQLDQLIAGSLDVSGDADIDGTMEADAYTVNGTALDEFIQDTVGAMFTGNTETNVSVGYQDGDGTIDVTVPDAETSAKGVVELATSAETITGTDTARAVTPDGLAARSVVATIAQSSLTDDNMAIINHALGTADVIVQLYDMSTEGTVFAQVTRTSDGSTASTNHVTVDFGRAPSNDVRCIITAHNGATSVTPSYT